MSSSTTSLHYAASRLLDYLDVDSHMGPDVDLRPVLADRPALAALVEELRDAVARVEVES